MKYIEVDKTNDFFFCIDLKDVLLKIKEFADNYKWSIQFIDAVGDTTSIIDMSVVELEKYCDDSPQGYIIDFMMLLELSKALKDVIDILIVGCESTKKIPKAYKTNSWESMCRVIISREDSSLWQFFSDDKNILIKFKEIKTR